MLRLSIAALLALSLAGCNGRDSAAPSQAAPAQTPGAGTSATATVGGATLRASTMDVADLDDAIAERYAIDRSSAGALLLVMVRDAAGNGIAPGSLRLDATAGALPDAPRPLALHSITTGGLTDYIGVFHASPPATVTFRVSAVRDGSRAEIATTAELYPR
jgi:hypothetical protein